MRKQMKFFDGKDWSIYPKEFLPYVQAAYETLKEMNRDDLMETVGYIALACKNEKELQERLANFFFNLGMLLSVVEEKESNS